MNLKNIEKKENHLASLTVEVDAAEFEAAVNKAYQAGKKDIYIPGFRKGKAPRAVVEGMYGSEVFYQDAIDDLAQPAFDFAVKEGNVNFVSQPSISNVDISADKILTLTFDVTLFPEAELGQYKGLEAVKESAEVTDEEIDAQVESVRKRNARMISVEREARLGDTANINYLGTLEGVPFDGGTAEGYDLELGSGTFVPGFEDQVVGMNIGEEKDINITFPENYHEGLAGKDVVFSVKLNSLTEAELPEIDDEFAKDVSEFETFEEYRNSLKEDMAKKKVDYVENNFKAALLNKAIENMTVTVPEVMVKTKIGEMLRNYAANFGMDPSRYSTEELMGMMGLDEESLNVSVKPAAEFEVNKLVLLEAVAKAENIEVSAEDIDAYIAKFMDKNESLTPEIIKAYIGEENIESDIRCDKAADIIFNSAVAAAE